MTRKVIDANGAVEAEVDEWLDGRRAAEVLGWENPNSVRNAAKAGRFRWRKRGNGRLLYSGKDIREHAERAAEEASAS